MLMMSKIVLKVKLIITVIMEYLRIGCCFELTFKLEFTFILS